ncbi:type III secretion system cytoplasmic ring protein SctQ [Paraburkholderia sp. JPY419]|uniref:type III secretion system cytoplasmic ring protein SctQ n=1 Tax=Paraburkholderia sp. JPY419 TaxID=667660 RepID=UPI003D1CFEC3
MAASVPELDDDSPPRPLVHAALVHRRGAGATDLAAHAAGPALPVAALRLTPVSHELLPFLQSLCDLRLADCAAQGGAQLIAIDVLAAGEQASAGSRARDPAVLRLAFSTADNPAARAEALLEVDLEQYPSLRIALGGSMSAPAAAAPDAAASRTRAALTLAVAALLVEPLLTRMMVLGFVDARLAGISRGSLASRASGPVVQLAYALADPARGATGRAPERYEHLLSLPRAALTVFDACVARISPVPFFYDLLLPGSIVLGVKALPVATLQELSPGDVLLRALFPGFDAQILASHEAAPDPAGHGAPAPRAVAVWGTPGLKRLCAAVQFDGPTPILAKEPYMSDKLDSAFVDAAATVNQADDLIRVGELELPVQFEIDTVAMPLAQLSTLGPGYVVEFPVPFADARLRLVVHGRTIGYGELVTVGEHLGVRIIRMAHCAAGRPRSADGPV